MANRRREFGLFEDATFSAVKGSIDFKGSTYTPNKQLAYLVGTLANSLPIINSKRRAVTAKTIVRSAASAKNQLVDFEHGLKFYNASRDQLCGAIASAYASEDDKAKTASLQVLIALWKKATGVKDCLDEIASDANPWKLSMEAECDYDETALWDGEKFYPWSECSSEMQALVQDDTVLDWNGKKMALVMGGEDGEILFAGAGLTRFPADKKCKIADLAASRGAILIQTHWERESDCQLAASASNIEVSTDSKPDPKIQFAALADVPDAQRPAARRKVLAGIALWNASHKSDPVTIDATAAKGMVIGCTQASADGHTHNILANLQIMPENGHSHYFQPISYDPDDGTLQGIASERSDYAGDGKYVAHSHMIELGPTMTAACQASFTKANPEDKMKTADFLREQATAHTKAGRADEAKACLEHAANIEKDVKETEVESVVASRIANGDLVPKAKHAEALAAATKTGEETARKTAEDAAAKAKLQADTIASRVKTFIDNKLDPKFVCRKDTTLEQRASTFACDEAGNKAFGEWFEEISAAYKKSGQAQLTASAATTPASTTAAAALLNPGAEEGAEKFEPAFSF